MEANDRAEENNRADANDSEQENRMDKSEKSQNEQNMDQTMMFKIRSEAEIRTKDVLRHVYGALKEKGYSPINQIVGYLLSGDPAYITSHQNARNLIRRLDRDELLEELVTEYLKDVLE